MKPITQKTAIQRINSFNEAMSVMESITNSVANEQKAMLESITGSPDYNGGVFDMDKILDVTAGSNDNEVQLYNAPDEALTSDDKRLIVSEFAKELEKIKDEVIDFGKIGAVATVIQSKFGFKQNLESFINELINTSTANQDSVAMAHGKSAEIVGENIDTKVGEEGSPTDIAPEKVTVDAVETDIPMGIDVGTELDEIGSELDSTGTDLAPIEDLAPVDEVVEPMSDLDTVASDLASDSTDVIPKVETEDKNEIAEENAEDAVEEGKEEESTEEETEETEDEKEENENLPTVNESIEARLAEIKSGYIAQMEAQKGNKMKMIAEALESKKLDTQLEAIKTKLKAKTAIKESVKDKVVKVEPEGMKKSITKTEKIVEKLPKQKNVKAKLESIVSAYHKKEELTAQLESISNGYKATVESIQKSAELDAKLNGLLESYQASLKPAITQKQVIKNAIAAVK